MSVSPARPARVLPRALLGLVLAAPAVVLVAPSANAAPRVEVEPLAGACGVRLSFSGLPAGTSSVHLDLVARDPERALTLTPPGPREVDGGSPSVEDVLAEGPAEATTSQAYRATVTLDGEAQQPIELPLPECADPAVARTTTPSPTGTASPGTASPTSTATPSPSGTRPSGTASASGTASPTVSATPSSSGSPEAVTATASATPTATFSPEPSGTPVFGPRAATAPAGGAAPSTSGSGVVALSGAVAAAPIGALSLPAAAPAPVVAPPAGGVAAAVAAPPPLAAPPLTAALPALPGRPAPLAAAPTPQPAAPEFAAAPPALVSEPAAADGPWAGSLPAALLVTGAAAGALGLRLRRRTQKP